MRAQDRSGQVTPRRDRRQRQDSVRRERQKEPWSPGQALRTRAVGILATHSTSLGLHILIRKMRRSGTVTG